MLPDVSEDELTDLYAWIDTIPLSRPKKHFARDFADGVNVAEVVHNYFPRLVQLHNYSPTSNSAQKMYNWDTLNTRVFKKLGFTLPKEAMESAAFAEPGAVEKILKLLRTKLALYQAKRAAGKGTPSDSPATGVKATPDSEDQVAAAGAKAGLAVAAGEGRALFTENEDPSPIVGVSQPVAAADKLRAGAPGSHLASEAAASSDAAPLQNGEAEELRTINEMLEVKVAKMEQLIRLKDAKIAALTARLEAAGLLSPR